MKTHIFKSQRSSRALSYLISTSDLLSIFYPQAFETLQKDRRVVCDL